MPAVFLGIDQSLEEIYTSNHASQIKKYKLVMQSITIKTVSLFIDYGRKYI